MAGLRDQLLKSGLVNEKQVKKAQREKHKEQRAPHGKPVASEQQQSLQQRQTEKQERDRQLNQQRREESERRALAAQARQLIEAHRLARIEGELPFHFNDSGKVKRLLLDSRTRDQLANGLLAIVRLDAGYEMVPRETAEKIRQRDPAALVLLNEPTARDHQPAADDPYAAYQIPDDLVW